MCVSVISRAKTNNLQQFCLAVPEVASKNVVAETDAKRRTDIGFVEGSTQPHTHTIYGFLADCGRVCSCLLLPSSRTFEWISDDKCNDVLGLLIRPAGRFWTRLRTWNEKES